jgi:hypothetical protein
MKATSDEFFRRPLEEMQRYTNLIDSSYLVLLAMAARCDQPKICC